MSSLSLLPGGDSRLRGRPQLYTDYGADQALLNTPAKRWSMLLLLALAVYSPWFMGRDWVLLLTLVCIYSIGSLGQNIVSGYAGQVSLGHAFFVGLGAYTAAFLGGVSTASVRGLELEMWIWLPMAGLVPAVVGFLVAPLAVRVRGLYLAILTLGLVFVGLHFFNEARTFTGGPGVGRRAAAPVVAGMDLSRPQTILGLSLDGTTLFYLVCLALLVGFAIGTRNLARSRIGRAFAAVRDRDIAAEIMGVPLTRTKTLAFTISSFYAGVCGALLAVTLRQIEPSKFDLFLSVEFLAMVLIGGVATVSGSIIGAAFIVLLPRMVQDLSPYIPGLATRADGSDGIVSVFQLNRILFGLLIIVFLVLEPRGIYGIWIRVRNYFKAWPFSY